MTSRFEEKCLRCGGRGWVWIDPVKATPCPRCRIDEMNPTEITLKKIREEIEAPLRAEIDRLRRINEGLVEAAKALRSATDTGDLPSVNWKDGKPYSYCPECGRREPI